MQGTLSTISAFAGIFLLLTPHAAQGAWPFTKSEAAGLSVETVAHDPGVALLKAAVNVDPNPSKVESLIPVSGGAALIADAGPDGTVANVGDEPKNNGRISLYVVRPGDTLSEIASMFEVTANTVLWANSLKGAKDIHPGDTLIILPVSGVEHTVAKGDTLASLAKKYTADAEEIATFNGLESGASLAVGVKIIIPGGEVPVAKKTTLPNAGATAPYRGGSGPALPGFFIHPVAGATLTQGIHGYNGVDLGAKTGTPIRAAASGKILISRTGGWNGGYGSYVVIDHGNGTQTLYGHMSRNIATQGASVTQGDVIGYVGSTGLSTGPHLHFEVRGARNPFASCRTMSICSI